MTAIKYRLLQTREIIQATDEWLDDDCVRWHKIEDFRMTRIVLKGRPYLPANYVPIRRHIKPEREKNDEQ